MTNTLAVSFAQDKATDQDASTANLDSLLYELHTLVNRIIEACNTHEDYYEAMPRWMLDVLDQEGCKLRDASIEYDDDWDAAAERRLVETEARELHDRYTEHVCWRADSIQGGQ